MEIDQLDLETRSKIYSYTKKVIRKYQKGITSGKLTADKFADNIFENESLKDILDDKVLQEDKFKSSYIQYIETLINIQNKGLSKSKKRQPIEKPTISEKIQLKKLLESTNYSLIIPFEYLNSQDVKQVSEYISTGFIDIGNEKIYNYVTKNQLQ